MSLTIIKAGVLDTIQDLGRYGHQNLGVNPGGAMDRFSAQLSNCLLGKDMKSAVIEMHFPAPIVKFNKSTVICITGADFEPVIAGQVIFLNRPVFVKEESILEFKKVKSGARCYLSICQGFQLNKWLGSFSTNLKAEAGGYKGRALKTGDLLNFEKSCAFDYFLAAREVVQMPWAAVPYTETATDKIEFIEGPEWHLLTEASQQLFTGSTFSISNVADRMGYRLKGIGLQLKEQMQLVSSGVCFGTVQLLPSGQLILLMADHQTTGGYPRIASVVSAHLPALAQMKTNEKIAFGVTDVITAEQKLYQQHQYLQSVQYASLFKMQDLLK